MNNKERFHRVWQYYHKIVSEVGGGVSWVLIHRRLFPECCDEPGHFAAAGRQFLLLARMLRAQSLGVDFGINEPPPEPQRWPDEDPSGLGPQAARLLH